MSEIQNNEDSINDDQGDTITVNVRGFHFELEKAWLLELKSSKLVSVITEKAKQSETSHRPPYLNRDPFIFSTVLDFYLTGELHMGQEGCAVQFCRELCYWGLDVSVVAPCCRLRLQDQSDIADSMERWVEEKRREDTQAGVGAGVHGHAVVLTRGAALWRTLEGRGPGTKGKAYCMFLNLVNVMFFTASCCATLPFARIPMSKCLTDFGIISSRSNATNSSKLSPHFISICLDAEKDGSVLNYVKKTCPVIYLYGMEFLCTCILTVDLVMRLVVTPNRKAFFRGPMNVINIILLVLVWTSFLLFIPFFIMKDNSPCSLISVMDVFDNIRPLRVISLLQLLRRYGPTKIVKWSVMESYKELGLLIALLTIFSLIFGSVIYLVEIQEDTIWTIPQGTWWAIITMTTVGYGDVLLKSPQGMMVGILCAITGIICVAMPVPIIANNFNKYYRIKQLTDVLDAEKKAIEERDMFRNGLKQAVTSLIKPVIKVQPIEDKQESQF